VTVRIGYKASAEQFAPRELLEFSVEAEDRGLDIVAVSDHFQPWRHHGGHAPSALTWLGAVGEATSSAVLATSVLTSTLRYPPSIVAQAVRRTRRAGPGPGHPRHRIRRGDERDPDDRGGVPGAQGAPDADGRVDHADASTADRGPRRLRGRVLPRVQGHDLRPPRAAGADLHRGADKAHTRFIVSDDPADVVDRIGPYLDLGFDDLVIHGPGGDQRRFLEQFTTDVLPALRERADRGIPAAATSASTA
jgi:alkanesulfonate monooxygenase SsuD/methylene tetrahydromethanopterin reductase-like flavin-dependent oxidoreductase (luciferase family)